MAGSHAMLLMSQNQYNIRIAGDFTWSSVTNGYVYPITKTAYLQTGQVNIFPLPEGISFDWFFTNQSLGSWQVTYVSSDFGGYRMNMQAIATNRGTPTTATLNCVATLAGATYSTSAFCQFIWIDPT